MKKILILTVALLATFCIYGQSTVTFTKKIYLANLLNTDSASYATQPGFWLGANGIMYSEGGVKYLLRGLATRGPFWKTSGTTAITSTVKINGNAYQVRLGGDQPLNGFLANASSQSDFTDIYNQVNVSTSVAQFRTFSSGVQRNLIETSSLGGYARIAGQTNTTIHTELKFLTGDVTNAVIFTDNRTSKQGIKYAASGYVNDPLSLATKEYVDASFGGGGSGWATTGTTTVSSPTISGAVTFSGGAVTFRDNFFSLLDDGDNTKVGTFQLSGITTGTTRTYTLPNASGTIALTSDLGVFVTDGDKGDVTISGTGTAYSVDVNINKAWTGTHSFIDGNHSFLDDVDNTKIAKFQASGITTGTTRTYTFPNLNGTLALTSDLANYWATTGTTGVTTPTINGNVTWNGVQNVIANSLGVTPIVASGLWLANNTAAAAAAQQISPLLTLEGQGWKTTATAGSQSVKFMQYVLPIQQSTNPDAAWVLASSINGGAITEALRVYNVGNLGVQIIVESAGGFKSNNNNSLPNIFAAVSGGASTQLTSTTVKLSAESAATTTLLMTSGLGMSFNSSFTRSSGTTSFTGLALTPTYNTTGTYVGNIFGMDYNPTNTSLTGATHYAIRTTSGITFLANSSGDTPSGHRLEVRGTSTGVVNFVGSGGASYFSINNAGSLSTSNANFSVSATDITIAKNPSAGNFTLSNAAGTGFTITNSATTTGTGAIALNGTFNPSSGTVNHATININPTWNTTGSYSGTVRDLYINPTNTSLTGATHIAFENTSGEIRFGAVTQDDTKTRIAALDATTGKLSWRSASTWWAVTGTTTLTGNVDVNANGNYAFLITDVGYGAFVGVQGSAGSRVASIGGGAQLNFNQLTTKYNGSSNIPFELQSTYTVSSGTATFNAFLIDNTHNFTGSYSGIVRGIYINPTNTSLTGVTHIAFENTSGEIRLGGVTQDDTKVRVAMLDATTNRVYWRDVATIGGGGGSISGLTTDFIPKATSPTTIGNSIMAEVSSKIGIGTSSPDRLLHPEEDNATNNAVTYLGRFTHTTSGTPAIGIGTGIEFETETSAGNNEIASTIESVMSGVGAANEYADVVFKTMSAGTIGEALKISLLAGPSTRLTVQGSSVDVTSSVWAFNTSATATNFKVGLQESAVIDRKLHTEEYSPTANTTLYPFRMTRVVQSGNGSAGEGVGVELELENGSGSNVIGATIEGIATDVTASSEDIDLVFKTMGAGAAVVETFRVSSVQTISSMNSSSTNSRYQPFKISHTTSGTPANGIGVGMQFEQETSSNNNELAGVIDFVYTDVTSTSEDADAVISTQTAGGTNPTEKLRIASDGVITNTIGGTSYFLVPALKGTATLDFASTLAQTDSDLTITVTGAALGMGCDVGIPNGSTLTGSTYTCWVSATNTVTVRFSVYGALAKDPASGTFNVFVFKQ